MTNPAILEALAEVIMNTPGDPHSYGPTVHDARAFAAAVLELVGPKPLHWMNNGNHWAGGLGWVVRKIGGLYVLTKASCFDQYFDTLTSAQAAAQAHADAAHWANTKIGGSLT